MTVVLDPMQDKSKLPSRAQEMAGEIKIPCSPSTLPNEIFSFGEIKQ